MELRRITLSNHSHSPRTIELTSYAEVVLASAGADAAHPAFSNLFVQTEFVRGSSAILCTRRARSKDERPPWLLHLMVGQGDELGEISCETDRFRFVVPEGFEITEINSGLYAFDLAVLREPMLLIAEGLALCGLLPIERVSAIRSGSGTIDTARDGIALRSDGNRSEAPSLSIRVATTARMTSRMLTSAVAAMSDSRPCGEARRATSIASV